LPGEAIQPCFVHCLNRARDYASRWVLGHRKTQQLPPLMAKNETYEEPLEGNRRNDKQID